jgi:hypothetical protein
MALQPAARPVHDIDGAPKKNQHAINVTKIRQPNDNVGKKG